MKKLIFLLMFPITIWSQQYLNKDFNDLSLTSGGWTTQVIIDTTNWFVDSFGGDDFAKCTNYNSGNVPANTWLISPGVDLSSSNQPILNFQTIMKWPGAPLVLYISTDYDGTSNPTQQGTWTDITSQALWDVDNTTWGSWTNSGDVDLSTHISSSTYIAYEYFGSSSSGSTWQIDNITINEGSPPPTIDTVSVYDIQYTSDPNGNSNYDGSQVYTGGIVYAVEDDSSFYIASGSGPWTGVYVYSNDYLLSEGDSVTLIGEVDEYYDLTELVNVTNVQVISTGNNYNVNNCSTGEASSEEFEGCLVEISNANCNNSNAGFGEWIVNDGTGNVIVDDLFFAYVPNLNTNYNVKGAVTYNYGAFKLLPRYASDVTICDTYVIDSIISCNSYTWIDGVTYTSSNNTATYTLQTNSAGCDSIVTLNLTINSLPNPDFSSNVSSFTSAPFVVEFYNATPNISDYNFTWDFGDDSTLQSNNSIVFHEYQYNGLYDVMLIAENILTGCVDTMLKTDNIYCSGGPNLSIIEVSNNINVFPNPTNDNITISVNDFNGNIQTEVYDLIGNKLQTTNETTISLRDYYKGIYILKVAYGDRVQEVKVIKD